MGKQISVMLWSDDGEARARCILDMNTAGTTAVPIIERLVRLSALPKPQKNPAMEQALSDPLSPVRDEAVQYLTSPLLRDPKVRLLVFQHFAPIALDPNSPLVLKLWNLSNAPTTVSQETVP
jgi:hypothetical protein